MEIPREKKDRRTRIYYGGCKYLNITRLRATKIKPRLILKSRRRWNSYTQEKIIYETLHGWTFRSSSSEKIIPSLWTQQNLNQHSLIESRPVSDSFGRDVTSTVTEILCMTRHDVCKEIIRRRSLHNKLRKHRSYTSDTFIKF